MEQGGTAGEERLTAVWRGVTEGGGYSLVRNEAAVVGGGVHGKLY